MKKYPVFLLASLLAGICAGRALAAMSASRAFPVMTTKLFSTRHAREIVAITMAVMAILGLSGRAAGAFYVNCEGCHTTSKAGMSIVNYQTVTNLGKGALKVFQTKPGQTTVIQLSVTNGYGGEYGLNINSLGAGGVVNNSDHMAYKADPTWSPYFPGTTTNFFMLGCMTASPELWTFKLIVETNTPADFYLVQTQMAGYDSASSMWSQQESFYVQVVAATPKLSVIQVGDDVTISWPDTGIYTLQQNSNLTASTAWETSGYAVATNANGTNSVVIPSPLGSLFFRLANP